MVSANALEEYDIWCVSKLGIPFACFKTQTRKHATLDAQQQDVHFMSVCLPVVLRLNCLDWTNPGEISHIIGQHSQHNKRYLHLTSCTFPVVTFVRKGRGN